MVVYRITGAFFFGAASTVGAVLDRIADQRKAFVLDFSAVPFLEFDGGEHHRRLVRKAERHGVRLFITGAAPAVRRVLLRAGARRPQVRYLPRIDDAVREAHGFMRRPCGTPS